MVWADKPLSSADLQNYSSEYERNPCLLNITLQKLPPVKFHSEKMQFFENNPPFNLGQRCTFSAISTRETTSLSVASVIRPLLLITADEFQMTRVKVK